MEAKQKNNKRSVGLLISGMLVVVLAGTVAVAIYFKLLPGEVSQLTAEWSQKLPFASRNDNTGLASATADFQPQTVDRPPSTDNAVAVPANAPNNAVAAATVASSAANAKPVSNQDQSAKNIKKLSQVYAGMKPEEAVAILKNLDIKTVSDILQKMEEEQAGKILAVMEAKRAAAVSQELLQYRSALPNSKAN